MVCSCALASDSDFVTNNILLMRNCVHFREKWQLVFQSCGRVFDLSTRPEKDSGDTKKATEIFPNVFRYYLKERELCSSYHQRRITFLSASRQQESAKFLLPVGNSAKQIQSSNDKTIIKLGFRKIS